MTITIADLVARVRAEGVQETAVAVKAVGENAQQTTRALEIMAAQVAKSNPAAAGDAKAWLELFQRTNVQPTAAALAQAAAEMQRIAAAATQAVAPSQATATAASQHATAARAGAQATQQVAEGWKLSESTAVRFAAGLAGVGLGISLVAGAARLVHQVIADTVDAQLDWERSLVQVRAIYGDIAPRVVALSQAQAALTGVTATQQQLLQANIAAGFLTTRYGVAPAVTGMLTTQVARLGGLLALPQEQQAAMQAAFLQYAQTGAGGGQLEQLTGQPFDALTLARRLGFRSEAALQALTPQQLVEARTALETATTAQVTMRGSQEQRGLLDRQRDLQHALEQAQAQLQSGLENLAAPQRPAIAGQSELALQTNFPLLGPAGQRQQAQDIARAQQEQQDYADQLDAYQNAVQEAQRALEENSQALADNQKQLDEANAALARFGVEAGSSTARLLSFTGSLEDITSIARADIAVQAQAAVAARGRSAIPTIGTPQPEIVFQATQTAYAQALQNFVARRAQAVNDNAIRDYLQQQATQQGPGLERQRAEAQRALGEAQRTQPIQQATAQAQVRLAQIELATAQTQADLERISLTQRARYVQMLQQTIDLRVRDNQLQQISLAATMAVIQAQQAALPAQFAVSAAQFQQNLAQALARQRMARLLQGQDVSGLPTFDELIRMNIQGQFAAAEAGPAAVRGARGVEVAGQAATAAGLAQALTAGQIRSQELAVDLANLGDLPEQTALELELVQNNRDQLSVQTEIREYLKALVYAMTNQPAQSTAAGGANIMDTGALDIPAPLTLAGARRPY